MRAGADIRNDLNDLEVLVDLEAQQAVQDPSARTYDVKLGVDNPELDLLLSEMAYALVEQHVAADEARIRPT